MEKTLKTHKIFSKYAQIFIILALLYTYMYSIIPNVKNKVLCGHYCYELFDILDKHVIGWETNCVKVNEN